MVHDGEHIQRFQETKEGKTKCPSQTAEYYIMLIILALHPHQPAGVAGDPGGQHHQSDGLSGGESQPDPLAGELPALPGTEGQRQAGDVFLQTSHFAPGEHEPRHTGGHQEYPAGDGKTLLL